MTKRQVKSESVVVGSSPSAIEEVFKRIQQAMETCCFNEDDIFAARLALQEAFTNAIRHGNRMNPSKSARIEYSIDSKKAVIKLIDQGNGFDPGSIPDPTDGRNLYKTGGRGLFLIRSYMDQVRFSNRGNCITMVKLRSNVPRKGRLALEN